MKALLVTLISEQTIPNIQFIKEMGNKNTHYLFLITDRMNRSGILNWIIDTCKIEKSDQTTLKINEYSLADIRKQLDSINCHEFERIVVNVTGGTRIMSLTVSDYFKDLERAEVYYVTGVDGKILKIYPQSPLSRAQQAEEGFLFGKYIPDHSLPDQETGNSNKFNQDYVKRFFLWYSKNNKKSDHTEKLGK